MTDKILKLGENFIANRDVLKSVFKWEEQQLIAAAANEFTAKFFGVSIAAEKEIIYIVSRKSGKDAIMKSIIEKAGPKTDARAAVFSLPVDDVAGLTSVTDKED